jgi:hypothetical protein
VLCCAIKIGHEHPWRCPPCETVDIHKALRKQENYIINNKNLIFSVTSRMYSQEEAKNFECVFIIETIHSQKRKIKELQVESVALRPLVVSLARNPTSVASNVRMSIGSIVEEVKEDEIVQHQ